MVRSGGADSPRLEHGHALVREGRIADLIDWGDIKVGHPAMDVGLAFSARCSAALHLSKRTRRPLDGHCLDSPGPVGSPDRLVNSPSTEFATLGLACTPR